MSSRHFVLLTIIGLFVPILPFTLPTTIFRSSSHPHFHPGGVRHTTTSSANYYARDSAYNYHYSRINQHRLNLSADDSNEKNLDDLETTNTIPTPVAPVASIPATTLKSLSAKNPPPPVLLPTTVKTLDLAERKSLIQSTFTRPFTGLMSDFRGRRPHYKDDFISALKTPQQVCSRARVCACVRVCVYVCLFTLIAPLTQCKIHFVPCPLSPVPSIHPSPSHSSPPPATHPQSLPAILFLYFACLAPAVSFGTISSFLTASNIGLTEFIFSCGASGVAYSLLSGQPMAFLAPTGLSLAFIGSLFRLTEAFSVPFLPIYAWVGVWTSLLMVLLSIVNASKLIRFCTRFTDEVFNALLSLNFIAESLKTSLRDFTIAGALLPTITPPNLTTPFIGLIMSFTTYWATRQTWLIQYSSLFNRSLRKVIKNFGPATVIIAMTLLNSYPPIKKFAVPTLQTPPTFQLSGSRPWLIDMFSVPTWTRLLCLFPAVALTALFFLDQNISVRAVNSDSNELRKPEAYNMDMMALGLITGALSVCGLPWMCGATVQSIAHVKSMTTYEYCEDEETEVIDHVVEGRTIPFVVHSLILLSVFLLPVLSSVPIPVVSGLFLYLGRKLMTGNQFLRRVRDCCSEKKRLPFDHPINTLGRSMTNAYTLVQLVALAILWAFKSNSTAAIFFPSVIGFLIFLRSFVLQRLFTEEQFVALGDASPSTVDVWGGD